MRAARPEILRACDFGTKFFHQCGIGGKPIDRENDFARPHILDAFARADACADHRAVFDQQILHPIAHRKRNITRGNGCEKIIDQILPATGHRRMQALHRMADMFIGGDQHHTRFDGIDQPFNGFGGDFGHALDKRQILGIAFGNLHQIAHHGLRRINQSCLALKAGIGGGHRPCRQRGIAPRPILLFHDGNAGPLVMGCNGCSQSASARPDHQNIDCLTHAGAPTIFSTRSRHAMASRVSEPLKIGCA